MRKIERIKGRKTGVWTRVALGGAAISAVALAGSLATANENRAARRDASASPLEASARSEGENGRFWPRLGSNASSVSTPGFDENAGFADVPDAAQGRVESANFVGYSVLSGFIEQADAISGRPRLVDWTTPEPGTGKETAAPLNPGQTPQTLDASNGEVGETAQVSQNGKTAQDGEIGQTPSRSKTPILRDERTAASEKNGSGLASALVSTFGALAVVLGAFFALVALLKRSGLKNGGFGGALEVVDSLPVGDKARLLTIRWGNRLILAAKTPEKITSLAEIDDVDEANAILAEIEGRKKSPPTGAGVANAAAIWKRGLDAANAWRTTRGTKGRRQ